MAKKKIVDENGKTFVMKEKKPFFKRVWFWILVVLVVVVGFSAFGGDDEPEATKVDKDSSEVKKEPKDTKESKDTEKEEPKEFKVGDTVSVDGYEITVNEVSYSDEEGYSTPSDGNQFVIINITINNNTDKKESFNEMDFSLNVDGVSSTTGFTYVDGVDTLSSGDLDPGAKVTGNLVGEAPADSKLKLRYEGNMFLQNHEVDITLR